MKFARIFTKFLPFLLLLGAAAPQALLAVPTAGLAIGKSASATNVPVGAVIIFNIGMTNTGSFTVNGIIGSDVMPGGLEVLNWTSTIAGQSSPPVYNPTTGQWTVATLAPGNTALLTIFAEATNGGTCTNVAAYVSPVTNSASVVVTVTPQTVQADLGVAVTAGTNSVGLGQTVVFTLTLNNFGPGNVSTNIVVTDCLPAGFQYVTDSAAGGGSPGTYNSSACTWTLPGLAANSSATLAITAQAGTAGSFTDTASVATPAGITDPNTTNNSSSVAVTVNASSEPISLVCPTNMVVAADGPNGATAVDYSATASGGCTSPAILFAPPSGSILPIGTNVVTCMASDTCGHQASCAFTVIVTPPPLTLLCSPNLTMAATNPAGAVVTYYNTVSDGCNGANVVSTPPSGSLFPLGPTLVSCTATDTWGQQAQCSFVVTVTPPSPAVPTTITKFQYDTNAGMFSLAWATSAGKVYTVQQSLDLQSWQNFLDGITAGGSVASNQIPVDPTLPASFFRIQEDCPVGPFSSDPILSVGEDAILGTDGGEFQPSLTFIKAAQQYYISQLNPTPTEYATWTTISNDVADTVLANALFIDYLDGTNAVTTTTPSGIPAKNDALRWYYLVNMKTAPLLPGTNGVWCKGIDPGVATNLASSGCGVPVFVPTVFTNSNQAYTNSCALKGVPIPPDMFTGKWVNLGQIDDPFISREFYAELWIYVSQNPPGVCLALPRYFLASGATNPPPDANIALLGLICLGFKAQTDGSCYACFWDNPAANRGAAPPAGYWKRGVARPITDFLGGTNLNAPGQVGPGGQCSDCHAGQNSFVVHPRKAAFEAAYTNAEAIASHGANLNGTAWYKPLVDPSWPQNPMPGTDQGGDSCITCHKLGAKAGRLPLLYKGVPDYCGTILPIATKTRFIPATKEVVVGPWPATPTMPPNRPGRVDFDDMKTLYLAGLNPLPPAAAGPVPMTPAPAAVSAPSVIGPLYATATKVAVEGAVLGATVTLYTNGTAAATIVNAQSPSQVEFTIPALAAGESVTASQTADGATSVSAPEVALDYFTNYPGPLPAPDLDEFTIYQGASVIEAIHDPGVTITVLKNGIPVAQAVTSSGATIIPLTNGVPIQAGDIFQAYETLNGVSGTNSDPVAAVADPATLPAPTLDTVQTYAGQQLLPISGLVNGAQVSVSVNGTVVGQFATPENSAAEFNLTTSALGRPLAAGDQVTLSQALGSALSSGPSTNLPPTATCGSLPAPSILPPADGAATVEVTGAIAGSQVLVYDSSGLELGCGSGSSINLSRPVVCGDILTVVQQVGGCTSAEGDRITVTQ